MLHVARPGIYPPAFSRIGDKTTNLLRHALAGALASLATALVLFPAHAQAATFAGAVAALLVNLDRCELPLGRRTPFGHSLVAFILWTYASAMALALLAEAGVVGWGTVAPIAMGASVGYASHLLLDAFGREGIYIFPNRRFPALACLPEGCEMQWAGWSVARLSMTKRTVPAPELESQKSCSLHTTNQ